jgi:hypothetical protein
MNRAARAVLAIGAIGVIGAIALACSQDDDSGSAPSVPTETVPAGGRCVVRLHGKGGQGAPTTTIGEVTYVAPDGNADGWGGRQWLYFPDEEYESARAVVAEAVAGCGPIIIHGFSNGASFAAAMYCRGETFDGRLRRVVIDDPVTDHVVDSCRPDPSVAVTLYATGALDAQAPVGWRCSEGDWTCQGGDIIGIDAWSRALGVPRQQSAHTDHQPYDDAPELSDWG